MPSDADWSVELPSPLPIAPVRHDWCATTQTPVGAYLLPHALTPTFKADMDSINKQQPEANRRDLSGADAVERVRETVKKTATCFFCTGVSTGGSQAARPMTVQEVDDSGALWILSASDSHTNAEVAQNPLVWLFFQGSEHSGFASLHGRATTSRDKATIKRLWKPILKTWFTEGEDDPRITALRVSPMSGYYWDNKHGDMVAGAKMAIGAAIGKTLDDSIEGTLTF
jgi:general stress protein 26